MSSAEEHNRRILERLRGVRAKRMTNADVLKALIDGTHPQPQLLQPGGENDNARK